MVSVRLLDPEPRTRRRIDRYDLIAEIAAGGMATVYLGRLGGVAGFQRFVALKVLHPHLAHDREFVAMFLDEARLAAGIHHPNVVPILEVGADPSTGYYLVMEYIEGDTLARIVARAASNGNPVPRPIVTRIVLDALAGLHAAHELTDERGLSVGLVHRDCSPQNVLVGIDGSSRITDFGVARATSRLSTTRAGKLKGKLAYMAPEQTEGGAIDRRADLFAMGIILWEVFACKRLFKADSEAATLNRILNQPIPRLKTVVSGMPRELDEMSAKALDRNPAHRFQTAQEMADALERAAMRGGAPSPGEGAIASARDVARYVERVLGQEIAAQRESVRAWLAQSEPSLVDAKADARPNWNVTVKVPIGARAVASAMSPVAPQPADADDTTGRISTGPSTQRGIGPDGKERAAKASNAPHAPPRPHAPERTLGLGAPPGPVPAPTPSQEEPTVTELDPSEIVPVAEDDIAAAPTLRAPQLLAAAAPPVSPAPVVAPTLPAAPTLPIASAPPAAPAPPATRTLPGASAAPGAAAVSAAATLPVASALPVPPAAPAPVTPAAVPGLAPPPTWVHAGTLPPLRRGEEASPFDAGPISIPSIPKRSLAGPVLVLVGLGALLVGGGIWWWRSSASPSVSRAEVGSTTTSAPMPSASAPERSGDGVQPAHAAADARDVPAPDSAPVPAPPPARADAPSAPERTAARSAAPSPRAGADKAPPARTPRPPREAAAPEKTAQPAPAPAPADDLANPYR